jgi:hypothetical protein
MPGSSDDDAPRWELPEWDESSSGSLADNVPRWEPDREVPRWQPTRAAAPGARAGARVRPRAESGVPTTRPAPPPKISPFARPFVWWAAHPWIVLWLLVCLTPGAVLALRALDESGLEMVVQPLAWSFVALFVVALGLAMVTSARRSVTRLAFGTIAAVVAVGVLLWPVTRVTLGRTMCPARAGADLGVTVARGALDAWQRGATGDGGWRTAQADGGWRDRSRAVSLLDYQLAETGCWERVAPIDGTHTWHEFRVTVQDRDQAALSKSVVVHTAAGTDGWKITAIEGPLP